ncbi:MAG: hypothetical protein WCW68_13545, partial [Methanothrix sp.]
MKSILKVILGEIESGPVKWIASILSIIATVIILSQYIMPYYHLSPSDNLTSDGVNSLNNNLDIKESKADDLVTVASQDPIPLMEEPAIKKDEAKYSDMPPLIANYSRTNEYSENSLDPFCAPESKQTTCPSQESCVDCDGACWSPGNYGGGKTICSNGMWTIKDSSSDQVSGYSRTNEY